MDKKKQSEELLNRIRDELNAILEENNSNDPRRKISYEDIMKPPPLPTLEPSKSQKKTKTAKKSTVYHNPQSHRQNVGGKSITMNPSHCYLSAGEDRPSSSSRAASAATSTTSLRNLVPNMVEPMSVEFLNADSAKSIDEDMQKMQSELAQSYKLFQSIGEKFEAISFGGLKSRIRDLQLSNSLNDLGKESSTEMQKKFDSSFVQNRLDKLTANVSDDFRRHPGEFGDIPEVSSFFQTCAQLEHGLDTLKQQRKRSTDLEKRLCWATEIAYERMEEIRNAVGDKPEKNF